MYPRTFTTDTILSGPALRNITRCLKNTKMLQECVCKTSTDIPDINSEGLRVINVNETFKAETHLNYIKKFSPYREENTTLHRYKDQVVKTSF
jgi:hypothetical protein